MSSIIDGEVMIRLDALTMVRLKMDQLESMKPRPDNHYNVMEELHVEYESLKEKLIELLILKNTPFVTEKLKCATHE